jgi:hypothetical protein
MEEIVFFTGLQKSAPEQPIEISSENVRDGKHFLTGIASDQRRHFRRDKDAECRSWLNLSVQAADANLKRIMATVESIVFVIDDDPSFRRSTEMLIGSAGLSVQTFGSAEEFLCSRRPDAPACLLLDVRLPYLSVWICSGN